MPLLLPTRHHTELRTLSSTQYEKIRISAQALSRQTERLYLLLSWHHVPFTDISITVTVDVVPLSIAVVRILSQGATGVDLLLHDGLRADNLRKTLQSGSLQPAGCVRLQGGDDAGFGDLVRSGIFHVDGGEEEDVGFGIGDARGNGLHDFAVDGLLVVGDEVLVEELLNLVGRKPYGKSVCNVY